MKNNIAKTSKNESPNSEKEQLDLSYINKLKQLTLKKKQEKKDKESVKKQKVDK